MDLFKRIIDLVEIKNELKRELVIDFFNIYITVFRDWIRETVLKYKFDNLENSELVSIFLTTTNNLLTRYDDCAKKRGIPEYFLKKFNAFHNETIMIVLDDIENILNNDIYGTQEQKVYIVLDSLKHAFHLMIKDAKISMDSINGQLNNHFYNSKRIGDYDTHSH